MDKIGDYYLGLDIGTNSVGWAVTDRRYHIPDYQGKAMWGIHLFDEAHTAKDRRIKRVARRRLERRKKRIILLREIFDNEIAKVDPEFFRRLDESMMHLEDRSVQQPNSLFNDATFKDADFHRKFPTIYHLRKYLMTAENPDIRLVYLAVHHIIKYRGHFLFADMSDSDKEVSVQEMLAELSESLEGLGTEANLDLAKIEGIVSNKKSQITSKKKELLEAIDTPEDFPKIPFANLLAGGKVKMDALFPDNGYEDEIKFSSASSSDDLARMEEKLSEEHFRFLMICKNVYDLGILKGIIGGDGTISDAKIRDYEQHKYDLRQLKAAIRQYAPDQYREMFKNPDAELSYSAYSGTCGKKGPKKKLNDQEEFCKHCEKILEGTGFFEDEDYLDLRNKIQDRTLAPKQTVKSNSILPFSVHRIELKKILENASKYHAWLNTNDGSGFTSKEKILMLDEFRTPYYVGPLGGNSVSKNAGWSKRLSYERITPWNFDMIVDKDASAKEFIENLTSYCTYLRGEKVIPKQSILYSRFQMYMDLNNMRINGNHLSREVKSWLIKDLFEKEPKVTQKKIRDSLVKGGFVEPKEKNDLQISGIDGDPKASLKSEIQLREILGNRVDSDRKTAEEIIETITVFETTAQIKNVLAKKNGDKLKAEEISKLSKLKFSGWSRLSEKFLTGIYVKDEGRDMNIMGLLEDTSLNLMEIMARYKIDETVAKINKNEFGEKASLSDELDRMYVSPSVKRSIIRTLAVVNDVVKTIGKPPVKLFVETTRENMEPAKKKRTESRKQKLLALYDAIEDDRIKAEIDGTPEASFNSRNLYLYYVQKGKCMYCGRKLDLDELNTANTVDRDHIIPQSKIVDNSIHNNLVLTCKEHNSNKSDTYPISSEIQMKMGGFWRELREQGFMTKEKYDRLTRTEELTDDELAKFISRQLVETSQAVKAVISVMQNRFGDATEVVFVKGNTVSDFRKKNEIQERYDGSIVEHPEYVKCRNVNDYHHAKDAYLNIVVGNVFHTKFTKDYRKFLKSKETYNLSRMYDYPIPDRQTNIDAWTPGQNGTIATVNKYMFRNNILFTKYAYVDKGGFYNETVYGKEIMNLQPRKNGLDPEKYGGYTSLKPACFTLAEYTVTAKSGKKKLCRSVEVLNILDLAHSKDITELEHCVLEKLAGKDPTVADLKLIIPMIKKNALFEYDKIRLNVSGTHNGLEFHNGMQLVLPYPIGAYCKNLFEFDEDRKNRVLKTPETYHLSKEKNMAVYQTLLNKAQTTPFNKVPGAREKALLKLGKTIMDPNYELSAQCMALNQCLFLFGCKSNGSVRVTHTSNVSDKEVAYLIHQSPSGLHEKRIPLSR